MKISDNDIIKMLAELPEIELPEGFHDEVMQKVKAEAGRAGPKPKKKSRTIWYIGSFAAAAAAVAVIMLTVTDFGQNQWNYGEFAAVADAAPPMAAEAEAAMEIFDLDLDLEFALGGGYDFDIDFDSDFGYTLEAETPISLIDTRLYQRNYGDFATGAGIASRGTEIPETVTVPGIVMAPETVMAPAAEPEAAMEIFGLELEDDLDLELGFVFAPEVGVPIARPDAELWSQNLDDVWAQAVTVSVFPFPEHLPTDLLDFELSEYFAFTFEIFIAVDDMEYARETIDDMGGVDDEIANGMILQPAFEDLEATFTALYALGVVEEYRVTATNTLVLSNMGRVYEIWQEANTIFITLLHEEP
jgi:hypothetical protein